jgi:hypothetical protein
MKRQLFAVAIFRQLCISVSFLVGSVHAQDWSMWRGARGDGISQETQVPTEWTGDKNIAWKTPVPGRGLSSPIALKGSIYVTTADTHSDVRSLIKFDQAVDHAPSLFLIRIASLWYISSLDTGTFRAKR